MANIAAITLENMPKNSSRYEYADLPKEQQAALFFECVTKETSKTVFDDFVGDIVNKSES